jgi:hypothetical protein
LPRRSTCRHRPHVPKILSCCMIAQCVRTDDRQRHIRNAWFERLGVSSSTVPCSPQQIRRVDEMGRGTAQAVWAPRVSRPLLSDLKAVWKICRERRSCVSVSIYDAYTKSAIFHYNTEKMYGRENWTSSLSKVAGGSAERLK